ncbi:helix-turn-helix domain-containing protein [Massilia sp. CFBP9026]|uniref:helix-turn-helix domain-containing protein n=1 Tax=Massilia sp. CFBP9026 TaxID=3096536 RepID=UPI002A6B81FE|nr:helix-turn-helix domain-containing protein [Massilia sp. CFBP9026]MDY0961767.1 helix-turn-helix domain-containing protein [Massilia sp. CFBP9026]
MRQRYQPEDVARNGKPCENQRMVDKQNTFAARLRRLRKSRGLSLAALAEKVGVSAQAVHKWENGGQVDPARQTALARALDVSLEWILDGEGSPDDKLDLTADLPPMPKAISIGESSLVPLMSAEYMLQWLIGNGSRINGLQWLTCPAPHGPRTYALRISDASMECREGVTSYSEGDFIFVDPDRKYQLNTRVVLFDHTAKNDFKAIVREFFAEDGKLYIRALNPAWPDSKRELLDDDTLSGTVIGTWRPEPGIE